MALSGEDQLARAFRILPFRVLSSLLSRGRTNQDVIGANSLSTLGELSWAAPTVRHPSGLSIEGWKSDPVISAWDEACLR